MDLEATPHGTRVASLGSRIVELRNRRGWNQKELARRADLRPARLSTLELGVKRPRLEEFVRIADALEISLDELWSVKRQAPRPDTLDLIQELEGFASVEELAGLGRLLQILLLGFRAALGPRRNGGTT